MKKLLCILCSLLIVLFAATSFAAAGEKRVVLGIDRIDEPFAKQLLAGKRLGLFTNQSGVDSKLRSSTELLQKSYNLTALFVPEHGLFGAVAAGETFESHTYKDIPVHSLYGEDRRPTAKMLDEIDTMVVDIQDVGIRHYTYFSSLAYIMEECAKAKKQVVVLDRPNPLGGAMQGPVLKPEYKTFIGLYELPLRHGLTIGEFASYIKQKLNRTDWNIGFSFHNKKGTINIIKNFSEYGFNIGIQVLYGNIGIVNFLLQLCNFKLCCFNILVKVRNLLNKLFVFILFSRNFT